MKKTILILVAISMVGTAHSQLRINSQGKSSFSVLPDSSNTPAQVIINGDEQTGLKVLGVNERYTGQPPMFFPYNTYPIAIMGETRFRTPEYTNTTSDISCAIKGFGNTTGVNYGVWGTLGSMAMGAGIYGSAYDEYVSLPGRYAGYFNGGTKVDGYLTVTEGIYSPAYTITRNAPDGTGSSAIEIGDDESHLERLSSVGILAVSKKRASGKQSSAMDEIMMLQSLSKTHYAIDAEALEEAFPDLVYELQDGQKAINYTELIPILVQSINELSQEVRTLKGENAKMSRELNTTDIAEVEATDIITLSQNEPNPWSTQTAIRMNIPERVKDAAIFIYDMSGKQVAEHRISGRGDTQLKLTAEALVPGMYIYTLIADGKVISTKRMILTK